MDRKRAHKEDISDDEDFVPYVPLKERRRLELEKREKYLKQKADPQPHTETVHTSREPVLEKIEKSEESSFGMKSNVSLLDQHTELKKIAEGLSSKWAAVASTVRSCRFSL